MIYMVGAKFLIIKRAYHSNIMSDMNVIFYRFLNVATVKPKPLDVQEYVLQMTELKAFGNQCS